MYISYKCYFLNYCYVTSIEKMGLIRPPSDRQKSTKFENSRSPELVVSVPFIAMTSVSSCGSTIAPWLNKVSLTSTSINSLLSSSHERKAPLQWNRSVILGPTRSSSCPESDSDSAKFWSERVVRQKFWMLEFRFRFTRPTLWTQGSVCWGPLHTLNSTKSHRRSQVYI